jgi:Methyltransferase domain
MGVSMDESFLKAGKERWNRAQRFELDTWESQNALNGRGLSSIIGYAKRRLGRDRGDDWNLWWLKQFEGYSSIPNEIDNAIEFGCGPYTNIRYVMQGRRIKHAFCSDPLIRHYVGYRGRWLSEAWRGKEVLIDDHPLEECPFASDYFNLVIMINVLDHVKDCLLCIDDAIRVTREEGFLVIGQDLSDSSDALRTGEDVGHPIKVDRQTLDHKLVQGFEKQLYKIIDRGEGRNPSAHCGTYIFIGKKALKTAKP